MTAQDIAAALQRAKTLLRRRPEAGLPRPGVSPERLRALVEDSHRHSPMTSAIQRAVPVALRIEANDS